MEGRLEKKVVHHTPDGGRLSVWSPRYVVLSHNHLLLKGQLKPGTGGEAVEHVHLLDINVLSAVDGEESIVGIEGGQSSEGKENAPASPATTGSFRRSKTMRADGSMKHPWNAATSDTSTDYRGWLGKKGEVNTKVQRRYCILHKGYLSWFKKEPTKDFCDAIDSGLILPQDPASGRAGTMCVTGGQLELLPSVPDKSGAGEKKCYFALTPVDRCIVSSSSSRRVEFVCDSDQERRSWFRALETYSCTDAALGTHALGSCTLRIYVGKYTRNLFLRAETPALRDQWLDQLQQTIQEAKRAREAATHSTKVEKARLLCAKLYQAEPFQQFVGIILLSNFLVNIVEAEVEEGTKATIKPTLDALDVAFTILYTLELALNLFVNWLVPFLTDGWSILDSVCVVFGIIGSATGVSSAQVVRTIRILRIIRIFRRFKSLRRIVGAVSACLLPLSNTFLIILVVNAIYSVLATEVFGWLCPELFGAFSLSFLTMIQVATGDGWATDVLRPVLEMGQDNEDVVQGFNLLTCIFFISFVLLVFLTLLNVTVTVLLEGFLSAIAEFDREERDRASQVEYEKLASSLDPLLATLSNFQNSEHLRSMIERIFDYFDVKGSGVVGFAECKEGLESLVLDRAIYFSTDDYCDFTQGHMRCDEQLALNKDAFHGCVRAALEDYVQRMLAHQMNESVRENNQTDAVSYLAQKMNLCQLHELDQRTHWQTRLQGTTTKDSRGRVGSIGETDQLEPGPFLCDSRKQVIAPIEEELKWDGSLGQKEAKGAVSDQNAHEISEQLIHLRETVEQQQDIIRAQQKSLDQVVALQTDILQKLSQSGMITHATSYGANRDEGQKIQGGQALGVAIGLCVENGTDAQRSNTLHSSWSKSPSPRPVPNGQNCSKPKLTGLTGQLGFVSQDQCLYISSGHGL